MCRHRKSNIIAVIKRISVLGMTITLLAGSLPARVIAASEGNAGDDLLSEDVATDGVLEEDNLQLYSEEPEIELQSEEPTLLAEPIEGVKQVANVVVFVQFKDSESENFMNEVMDEGSYGSGTGTQYVDRMYDGEGAMGGMTSQRNFKNYINYISRGKVNVVNDFPQYNGTTIVPYIANGNMSDYESDDYGLVTEAIQYIDANTNIDYDLDGDGVVDNVTVFVEGGVQDQNSTLYPHKSNYEGSSTINGKRVGTYNVLTEDRVLKNSLEGVGTITHEFLHSLGYPDLYHYNGNGNPVGGWDIMSRSSTFLQLPLSYLRNKVSEWNEIQTTDTGGTFTLHSFESDPDKQALILQSPLSNTEFFVVEFRKKSEDINNGIDYKIGGSGIIIYRVNQLYYNNADGNDYIYVMRPEDSQDVLILDQAFLSQESGRTSMGSTDLTKSAVDGALSFSDGQNSGIVISNVGSAAGDTITFDVSYTDTTTLETWDKYTDQVDMNSNDVSMAFDSQGYCYTAQDMTGNNDYAYKVVVNRYDGTSWSQFGGVIDEAGARPMIGISSGEIYVLYQKFEGREKYYFVLKHYNKTSQTWDTISGLPTENGNYSALYAGEDGVFVARSLADDKNMTVYQLNGAGTLLTQIGKFTDSNTWYCDMQVSSVNGRTLIAYRNAMSGNTVTVKYYQNGMWENISGSIIGSSVHMVQDNTYAYVQAANYIYQCDFSNTNIAWVNLGKFTDIVSLEGKLELCGGMPYVAYTVGDPNSSEYNKILVKRFSESGWIQEGIRVVSQSVYQFDLAIVDHQAYVAVVNGTESESGNIQIRTRAVKADTMPGIEKIALTDDNVTLGVTSFEYDGTAKKPSVAVESNQIILKENTDYTVEYASNVEPGTAKVTVTGIGSYTGTVEKNYIISLTNYNITYHLDNGTNSNSNPGTYTMKTETITLVNPTRSGYDFVGWYKESTYNTQIQQIVKGSKGDLNLYAKWSVQPTLLNSDNVTLGVTSFEYDGTAKKPSVSVESNQIILKENTDYTVEYASNVEPGTAKVTVTGIGNYTGTVEKSYIISLTNYNITYHLDNGTNSNSNPGTYTMKTETITLANPTRSGYDFVGWYKESTYNTQIQQIVKGSKGDLNLYAKWKVQSIPVTKPLQSIILNKTSMSLTRGNSAVLSVSYNPTDTTDSKTVTWTSSNSYVAMVLSGNVIAQNVGTAVITANVNGKQATCTVTVNRKVAGVQYRTHVQTYGWQDWKYDGTMSGTQGQSKRLEGICMNLTGAYNDSSIIYRTHVQTYGWQNYVSNGTMSGTSGEAKRLEAIQIDLAGSIKTDYDIYYRVHAQHFGWLGWTKNGAMSGTAGYAYRLEGIEVRLVPKGALAPGSTSNTYKHPLVTYNVHCQSYGWLPKVRDGQESGTTGQAKRLEGICINLSNQEYGGDIQYRTHIQTYGWESGWKSNGAMSGTSGQAKRLEAIQIQLTGDMANRYDVYYRVHAQHFGWLGWAKNGESAGTAGYAYRLESIQIVLVVKGGAAPGSTNNCFQQN